MTPTAEAHPAPRLAAGARSGTGLVLYFVLAYAITWTFHLAILALGVPLDLPSPSGGAVLYGLGLLGPLAAALLVSIRQSGASGVQRLLLGALRWRLGWLGYLAALFTMPGLLLALLAVHAALGGNAPAPWLPVSASGIAGLVASQAWVVIGEEYGWRGFALPRLVDRWGALGASFVLGPLWACWHLPMFFVPGSLQYGSSFPQFLVGLVLVTVMMTSLYLNTGRSALSAMLFHASLNISASSIRLPSDLDPVSGLVFVLPIAVALWLLPRPWFRVRVKQRIAHVALVVRDYDEAIEFYTQRLGFILIEDTPIESGKRWVLVGPPSGAGTSILLARAADEEQRSRVGNQTGGRVFLFLHTDDFWRDYHTFKSRGVSFVREPRDEPYGVVAVFEDLYGNRWDLLQLASAANSLPNRPRTCPGSRLDDPSGWSA
jgi:membrane protease YdiL (CAAX protease family)/catechol 2,3-dioxygenase-like lactoylglutathione lyase family enzyme